MTNVKLIGAAVTAAALISPAAAIAGSFGSLNTAFAGTGYTTASGQLLGIATNPAGDIYAAGQSGGRVFVEELSEAGQVLHTYTGGTGTARGVAVTPGGDVVVAGTNGSAMLVEELSSALTPVAGFGSDGVATAFGGESAVANAVVITPGGEIVAGGSVSPPNTQAAVAEFTAAGALDTGFGSGGAVLNGFGGYGVINGLAVEPGGQIAFVGSQTPSQITNAVIGMLNANGSADSTFAGGVTTYHYTPSGGSSGYTAFESVAVQGDGDVVVGGVDYGGNNALLLRYDPDGSLDGSFGSGGVTAFAAGENIKSPDEPVGAYGVGIAGGGDIIGAGQFQDTEGAEDAAVWATTPSGSPDASFGNDGTTLGPAYTTSGPSYDSCALAVEPDGTIVVAGYEPTQASNDTPCTSGSGTTGFVASYTGNGPAPTGGAPTAVTGAAGPVGTTTATLTGEVDPDGLATTYSFQYGKSDSYGSSSAPASAGSGDTASAASASLSGLTPGTTYDYRLVSTNADGTTYGSEGTFTTSGSTSTTGSAPKVTTGSASKVGETGASVSGTVDPGSLATTYEVQYGTSKKYGSKTKPTAVTGASSTAVKAALSGLKPNTTYHYRLVATNADGTAYGAGKTLKTAKLLKATLKGTAFRDQALSVTLTCSAACSSKGTLELPAATAKRLKLGQSLTTVAGGSAKLKRAGTMTLKLKLTKAAATALAGQRLATALTVVVKPSVNGPAITYKRTIELNDR